MASYDVNGKVALVTGAERGIGFATAEELHARGAAVVLVDLDEAATQAAAERIGGDRVLGLGGDVTDRAAMQAAVDAAVERFGGLDVVVANAGIAPSLNTIRLIEEDAFERVVEVDLLGVWRTVRPALPQIVERRGHVVVVASVYAFFNGVFNASYAMSKAGVESFGRSLRTELAPHGASASVAYFGFIDTKMVQDGFSDPIAQEFETTVPNFFRRRLPPSAAGQAIADGIARRAPRIVAPKWWAVWSTLRGILNPLFDARAERDAQNAELVRRAEAPERQPAPEKSGLPAP
ncbi:MAG TPA: short-chain dehydrogenase/reductase [Solirubrobacteraceae bacterium]|nr:short-chain dehydrogenase/reductase [Solirubrobacteraceae bacterium]